MDVGQNGRPRGPQMWMSSLVLTIHNFGVPNFDPYPYGYGSIPINTIFSGLFTSINPSYFDVNYRGTRFWHTAIYDNISKYIMDKYSNCGKYMSEKVPDANLLGSKPLLTWDFSGEESFDTKSNLSKSNPPKGDLLQWWMVKQPLMVVFWCWNGGLLSHGSTPSYHPFFGVFEWNKPSSDISSYPQDVGKLQICVTWNFRPEGPETEWVASS